MKVEVEAYWIYWVFVLIKLKVYWYLITFNIMANVRLIFQGSINSDTEELMLY